MAPQAQSGRPWLAVDRPPPLHSPAEKGMKALERRKAPSSSRKCPGSNISGFLNWVASRCTEWKNGRTLVPCWEGRKGSKRAEPGASPPGGRLSWPSYSCILLFNPPPRLKDRSSRPPLCSSSATEKHGDRWKVPTWFVFSGFCSQGGQQVVEEKHRGLLKGHPANVTAKFAAACRMHILGKCTYMQQRLSKMY